MKGILIPVMNGSASLGVNLLRGHELRGYADYMIILSENVQSVYHVLSYFER